MESTIESVIKDQILKHLRGGEAFMPLHEILERFSFEDIGVRMGGLPYSPFEMFYHIVFTQKDILDFCTADAYKTRKWPDDYWPGRLAPKDEKEWETLKNSYFEDRDALIALAQNSDLSTVVKHGTDQTLLRELLLVIEHTAYHTGQLVVLARLI